jgi:hypothetical protein
MMGHCRYQAFRHGSFGALVITLGLQATQLQFMPANALDFLNTFQCLSYDPAGVVYAVACSH